MTTRTLLHLALTVLTSSCTAAVVVFILKKAIEGRVKHFFDSKLKVIEHQHDRELTEFRSRLASLENKGKELYRSKLDAFTHLSSVIYRCRLAAKDIIERMRHDDTGFERKQFEEERELLVEALMRHRIFLDEKRFEHLHTLKQQLQAFSTYLWLRGNKEIDESDLLDKIEAKFRTIDDLYRTAVDDLQRDILINP